MPTPHPQRLSRAEYVKFLRAKHGIAMQNIIGFETTERRCLNDTLSVAVAQLGARIAASNPSTVDLTNAP